MAVTTIIWVWHICSILDLTEDGALAGSLALAGILAGYFAYPIFDRWMRQVQPEVPARNVLNLLPAVFELWQAALRCGEQLLPMCFEVWRAACRRSFTRETREVELSTDVPPMVEVPQSRPEEAELCTDVSTRSGNGSGSASSGGSGSGSWNVPASLELMLEAPQSRPVEVDLSTDGPPYVPPSLPP